MQIARIGGYDFACGVANDPHPAQTISSGDGVSAHGRVDRFDQCTGERIDDEQAGFAAGTGVAVVDQHGILAVAHEPPFEFGQGVPQLRKVGTGVAHFPEHIRRSGGGCPHAGGYLDGKHCLGAGACTRYHQVAPEAACIVRYGAVGIELGDLPIDKIAVRISRAGEVKEIA